MRLTRRGNITPALRLCAAPVLLCLLLAAGCSTYTNRSLLIKDALVKEDYDEALVNVEKIDKGNSELLYYYEKGLILHYQNRYAESNEVFALAELLIEDLYTKSVTRELAALAINDAIANYRGEPHEAMLIHYYKILNYIYLGDTDGAAVECRRVNIKLQILKDAGDEFYENDPFLQYLTALVFEQTGERTDAEVSYRVAADMFSYLAGDYGIGIPSEFYCDAAANARRNGDREAVDKYLEQTECPAAYMDKDMGALSLFLEVGYVAHKKEENLVLPIFSNDSWTDPNDFAVVLVGRRGVAYSSNRKVDYWLRIALPVLQPTPAPFHHAAITARPVTAVDSSAGPVEFRSTTVENLDQLTTIAFTEKQPKVLLRATIRALGKYAAKKAADQKDEAFGFLVNIAGAATENADTRSWSTLPEKIMLGRTWLPPGTYNLDVELRSSQGATIERFTIDGVSVRPGETSFLNYRVY